MHCLWRACRSIAILCLLLSASGYAKAGSAVYYVRADGNDANDGLSPATAWRTATKVNKTVKTTSAQVYFRAGDAWTNQRLNITWGGTVAAPAVVGAYYLDVAGAPVIGVGSHARPVFSDNYQDAGLYKAVVSIASDSVYVQDIEVDQAGDIGIRCQGEINVLVDNVKIVAPYRNGIEADNSSRVTIENSEVVNDNVGYGVFHAIPGWGNGITINQSNTVNVIGNFVHEGYGEGIDAFYGSKNVKIQYNRVFGARAIGVYMDSAQNVDVSHNMILGTSNPTYWRFSKSVGPGIALNNERYAYKGYGGTLTAANATRNIQIHANLVAGAWHGLDVLGDYPGVKFTNIQVYNNSFVDNMSQITFLPGPCDGAFYYNNLLMSISTGATDWSATGGAITGVTFETNYWSRGNPGAGRGGWAAVYAGAQLRQMSGWRSIASVADIPSWESFAPTAQSLTIGHGRSLLSAPFNVDYNAAPFGNPMDIGAIAH